MGNLFSWMISLPVLLRILLVAALIIGALAILGAAMVFMSGESTTSDFRTTKGPITRYLWLPVGLAFIGLVTVVSLLLILGPVYVCFDVLHWPYGISFLVGLPTGIGLIVAGYALFEAIASKRSKRKL